MIITKRELNKYTFIKRKFGRDAWSIDWPRVTEGREDWRAALHIVAERCGHKITLDRDSASVVDMQDNCVTLTPARVGDWRAVFLQYADTIISNKLNCPPVGTVFPAIEATPVPACLRDGFTPTQLYEPITDTYKGPMLRQLRDVSRSELMRLDGTCDIVQHCGAMRGHTTDLALFECACGRLIVAHKSIMSGTMRDWTSCGCGDWSLKRMGYDPEHRFMVRAAWREWCTMRLASDPCTAINSLLAFKKLSDECKLPPHFEDFWRWFSREAKRAKFTHLQRIDPREPFTMDNLQIPERRWLFEDPGNGQHFKLGI